MGTSEHVDLEAKGSVTWTMSIVKTFGNHRLAEQAVFRLLRLRFAGWAQDLTRIHSGPTTVVNAWFTPAGRIYGKAHRRRRKYLQEKQAYLLWSSLVRTPRLLDYSDDTMTLLLTEARGQSGSRHPLPLDAHRAAGRWLRRLHSIEADDQDDVPWLEALRRRVEALQVRASPIVDASTTALTLQPVFDLLRTSAPMCRVPCHRDYEPRNWVYDGTDITVLDFEHARLDAAPWDLTRLGNVSWATNPASRSAFAEGYGPTDGRFWDWVDALTWMDGLSTLVWGLTHRDREFIEKGRRTVDRAVVARR